MISAITFWLLLFATNVVLAEFTVSNLVIESKKRVGRTTYEYTARVNVTNSAASEGTDIQLDWDYMYANSGYLCYGVGAPQQSSGTYTYK